MCSVAQLCLTLCDLMDCSPPGSSVHGIFQARILEWVVISYSRGSSLPKNWTRVSGISYTGRWILYHCCSVAKSSLTLWGLMDCSMPGFPVLHCPLEFAQTHVDWVRWSYLTISSSVAPSPPTLNLSQHQGLFQWVGSSHQVAKVLGLQLQQQSSSEYSGLISFKVDWFDLLAVQGTLKSLLQHHSLKASVLWCSAFFMIQFLHP